MSILVGTCPICGKWSTHIPVPSRPSVAAVETPKEQEQKK